MKVLMLTATVVAAMGTRTKTSELASLSSATEWINSPPLTAEGLQGKVVLVQFWTYSCVNWIRTVPYVRAWARKYGDKGLVVIGVHAPEFEFEKQLDNARWGAKHFGVDYPVAVDNDFSIWRAVAPRDAETAADWDNVKSPETYLGSERSENQVSSGARLRRNQWALHGEWTVQRQAAVLNQANGRITYRFHARDLNLVMTPAARVKSLRFRVLIDGQPPGPAHGIDVDQQGSGIVAEPRMYQLIRQPGPVADHDFEIQFLDPGVEVFVFTFG